jgi:uncharacterized protein YndB with AHSA1/START domain/effector-binding domain-containing protein
MVFDAYTKPEFVRQWMGAFGKWTMPVCTVDLRVGGTLRYEWRGPDGESMGYSGTFIEIDAPARLVNTERFDDPWYEGDATCTATFDERDGKTTLTLVVRYASQAIRDAVLQSPATEGVNAGYDTMERLLARISTPEIVDLRAQPMAVIHVTVPHDQIQTVMGPGIQELMAEAARQGIAIVGPWQTHHFRPPTDTFDFEIAVPVASAVKPNGRVAPSTRPAMRALTTTYSGPYDGLGPAWTAFVTWATAQRHATTEDLWELYITGPESGPDASAWRTTLIRPLQS